MTKPRNWKRHPQGWLSPDGEVFCERGAPMSGGGTAWMVWVRLDDDEVDLHDADQAFAYPKHGPGHTDPVRRFSEVAGIGRPDPATPWFRHTNDAGSLAEAKHTGAVALVDLRLRRALRAQEAAGIVKVAAP